MLHGVWQCLTEKASVIYLWPYPSSDQLAVTIYSTTSVKYIPTNTYVIGTAFEVHARTNQLNRTIRKLVHKFVRLQDLTQ